MTTRECADAASFFERTLTSEMQLEDGKRSLGAAAQFAGGKQYLNDETAFAEPLKSFL